MGNLSSIITTLIYYNVVTQTTVNLLAITDNYCEQCTIVLGYYSCASSKSIVQ